MTTTDTSERGLEDLIISALTGLPLAAVRTAAPRGAGPRQPGGVRESATALYSHNTGQGYVLGNAADFNRDCIPDLAVTNSNSNVISVLLGNGAGGFGTLGSGTLGCSGGTLPVKKSYAWCGTG